MAGLPALGSQAGGYRLAADPLGPWIVWGDALVLGFFMFLLGVFLFFGTITLGFALKFRPSPRLEPDPNPGPVAIIVPVKDDPSIFNSLPFLESIEYPDYRVVIVDDSKAASFRTQLDACATDRITIERRGQTGGRKAGALNFALRQLAAHPPEYVVILDADHRPPRDFLARAVTAIEETGAHCVCGYQKHDVGSHGFFGLFYRASQAATVMNMKARHDFGYGPVFSGAAAIFRYDWLRRYGLDETSITEDWELSLRSYAHNDFKIVVREDLWVSAAVPKTIRWFIRQQRRWTEGTTRDFRKHVRRLFRSDLSARTKLGLAYQGLLGLQNPTFLLFWIILPVLFQQRLPVIPTLGFLIFLAIAWGWPLIRASRFEGYGFRELATVLLYGFVVAYILAPFGTYAFFSGLVRTPSSWRVTKRRG